MDSNFGQRANFFFQYNHAKCRSSTRTYNFRFYIRRRLCLISVGEWRRRAGGKSSLSGRTGGGREEGDYGGAVEGKRDSQIGEWRARGGGEQHVRSYMF